MVAFRCTGRSRGWCEDLRHFLTIWYPPLQRRNRDLTFLTFYVLVRLKNCSAYYIIPEDITKEQTKRGVIHE